MKLSSRIKSTLRLPYGMLLSQQFYGNLGDPVNALLLKQDIEHVEVLKQRALLNHLKLSTSYVDRKKKSDTLFVLGSGESINYLTAQQWRIVKEHNSLAFNYFFAHTFIPDYYMIELNKWNEMHIFYNEIAKKKYANVDMFIQYEHALIANYNFDNYPYPENLYVHVPYRLPSSSCCQLKKNILYCQRKGLTQLFHHSSHTDCAILMGFLLGYKKIVLLGVDLNGSPYFTKESAVQSSVFPCNDEYVKMNCIREAYMKSCGEYYMPMHPTMNKAHTSSYHALTLRETISVYDEQILRPNGIQLFVGHAESILSSDYPIYFVQ